LNWAFIIANFNKNSKIIDMAL